MLMKNTTKKNPISRKLLCSLLSVLLLSGCTARVTREPEASIALPAAFSRSGNGVLAQKWWLSFGDQQLNTLIEQALSDNFTLKSGWDRLHQAQAVYGRTRSGLFPSLDGEADGSHTFEHTDGVMEKSDTLSLGLAAAYEVDLWGKIGSEVEAARFDVEATGADLDAAAMTLAAEVAATWFDLVGQSASLWLLEVQIRTNTKGLDLITVQFRTGQVPFADVLQQRQLIESQQGDREQLLAQKAQTEHALAILLGAVPGSGEWSVPAQLVELPGLPATGIPAEAIQSRPDVRSSFLALQAADQRVAVAVADRYPSLRLSASLETINRPSTDIFSDYLGSLMAGLTAPLLDGGSRKAEVRRTRAVAAEQLHLYGQALLDAVGEVEDALVKERRQQLYIQSLDAQLDLAEKTLEQVKDRYLKGVEDYQRVLTALISLQSLQQTRISAHKELLLYRIELCRALGSGWKYSKA